MGFAALYNVMQFPRSEFARGMLLLDAAVLVGELARLRIKAVNNMFLRCESIKTGIGNMMRCGCFVRYVVPNVPSIYSLTCWGIGVSLLV